MFCSAIMAHIIVVIHSSSIQVVTRKGLWILWYLHLYFWHFISLLLTFINHDPRLFIKYCHVVTWTFYKKTSKYTPLQYPGSRPWSPIFWHQKLISYPWIHVGQYLHFFTNELLYTPLSKIPTNYLHTQKPISIVTIFTLPHNVLSSSISTSY